MFTRDSLPRVFYTALEYIDHHALSDTTKLSLQKSRLIFICECIRFSNKLIGIYVFRFILRTQNDKWPKWLLDRWFLVTRGSSPRKDHSNKSRTKDRYTRITKFNGEKRCVTYLYRNDGRGGTVGIIISGFVGLNVPTFDLLLSKQATIVYIGR